MRHVDPEELKVGAKLTPPLMLINPVGGENQYLSILKDYAKVVFNKVASAPQSALQLPPLEKAKFDAANAMIKEGKTTRYAFYKFKNEFEQPLLKSLKETLSSFGEQVTSKFDLSDGALRKLALFTDKLDQVELTALKENDPKAYSDFILEAYNIANMRVGRSKTKRITQAFEQIKSGGNPEKVEPSLNVVADKNNKVSEGEHSEVDLEVINLNKQDLNLVISKNINGALSLDEIDEEIQSLAKQMQGPFAYLKSMIGSMSSEDRKVDGIGDRCFYLFQNFNGVNTGTQKSLGAIENMMRFMMVSFSESMPDIIEDLKIMNRTGAQEDFLQKYAPVMIKTYQFLVSTPYLTSGVADVKEGEFIAFIKDIDRDLGQIPQAQTGHRAPALAA